LPKRPYYHFALPHTLQIEHAQFAKAKGCVKDPNWEKGGLMRVLLDPQSPLYQAIYRRAHLV
jgi:hypothetical protein